MNVNDMPPDPAKRWEWIKYQLRIKGSSVANLARQLGVTDRAIRATKQIPYPRMERAIAETLGLLPMQLWPERWNSDGTPRRQRPNTAERRAQLPTENSLCCPVAHCKNGPQA